MLQILYKIKINNIKYVFADIYLKRDDIVCVVLQQVDEIWGDVRPPFPDHTVPPVLSTHTHTHNITFMII